MAATEVQAVAGADGGGSCGDGLAPLTPILTAEIKRKEKIGNNLTAAPILFTRPRRLNVTGVCVMQNWKAPRWLFQAERILQAGKCSQLVDWYQRHQNLHRSCHSSCSLAPAQLHARLAAQPPASILYLRFTVVSHDLNAFVWCVHPSQTRRWSCGRSASETSVQRATTWRMRTDGYVTHRLSPRYG